MAQTRSITRDVAIDASARSIFDALLDPGAVQRWWGASLAAIEPVEGGLWAGLWGPLDAPDFVASTFVERIEAPHRLRLAGGGYYARDGGPGFDVGWRSVDYRVRDGGIEVVDAGFPTDAAVDAFYAGCQAGWDNTLGELKSWLESRQRAESYSREIVREDGEPGLRGSEGCHVLGFREGRRLAFSWNAPPHLPETRAQRTWVTVDVEPAEQGTRVVIRHRGWPDSGWSRDSQWPETHAYFEDAWSGVARELAAHCRSA